MIKYPEIAQEWDYVNNQGITPEDFSPASNQKVWWTCKFNHNHKWQARICNRTILGYNCPICTKEWKISYPAIALAYYLYQIIPNIDIEVPFNNKYKIDIILQNEKIAIEHDGYYYHGKQNIKKKDLEKVKELENNGYTVYIICDSKEINNIVIDKNKVIYPHSYQYKFLNEMISTFINLLNFPKINVDIKKDQTKINYFYYHMRKKQTLAYKNSKLAHEWSDKNIDSPDTISYKSRKKVYWKCPKCNCTYLTSIINRVNHGVNCPYCSNHKINETNNLAFLYPKLMQEWDYKKNKGVNPSKIAPGKELKVWWHCSKGHTWQTYIFNRTGKKKSGCPYCTHNKVSKETSLKTIYPNIALLWHPTKNKPLTSSTVTAHSNKQIWWLCPKGHEWKNSVNNVVKIKNNKYCPYCNNRKKT